MEYSSEFGHCKSEEIFEFFKSAFVEHFNKEHRDLLMKKGLPLPKKKFTKIENGVYEGFATEYVCTWENIIPAPIAGTMIVTSTPISGISVFQNMAEAEIRVPEYETLPEVNPRNLDRNERFRLGLRT